MDTISDEQLLEELRTRLNQSRRSLQDISVLNHKLVEMNRRLEQSESLKSNFLSNIRNEINNPLNAIIGLAGHLASLVNDPQAEEIAGLIHAEAFSLDYQLRNIFIAAELEAGDAQPEIEQVDVVSVIVSTLDNFKAVADAKGIRLAYTLIGTDDAGRLRFPTDAEKLQVVLSNLVANAVEFSSTGSEVEVLAGLMDDELHIQVKDQGIGIAAENLERIFDRFTQLDTGSTRAHRGHGLGLSIVKALLDLLQGTIEVQSSPDVGSVFSVTLFPAAFDESAVTFAEGGNLFLFDELDEK
ncbi:sensor histidine kinase [Trichlorobacter ammonificans]|uniref:histidine kinase n=1 Tax=Trichlorobacter ammonificans TaxID=2916410 RepID=A0ABM9D9G7_9BACT|nr:HAMP domain-containing sensor histidine kinase [Trichlorobacter ammonificans]CAH2031216.1 Histidine kinase [Trichlorobacter ammonificans]